MKLYYGMMQKYPNELLVLRWWYQYVYNSNELINRSRVGIKNKFYLCMRLK